MNENKALDKSDDNQDHRDPEPNTAAAAPRSVSRRSLFGRVSASAAAAAVGGIGLPSLLLNENAASADEDEGSSRRARSYRIRVRAASANRDVATPRQITNGDETRYSNFIGNYSQGLPHNSIGEVDPTAYRALLTAVASGNSSDFASIPMGGSAKLAGPQGGLAFDLEGTDCAQMTIPPAPALASAARAGEMVENYWMAMARDIPFSQYGAEPITAAAILPIRISHNFFCRL